MLSTVTLTYLRLILLLIGSNVFMTLAWWALTLERSPANRGDCGELGSRLRGILHGCAGEPLGQRRLHDVFVGFSIFYLKEPMSWNYAIGFALIAAGAFFVFRGPF
jgi:uncharacterized protein